ncbi:LytR C-terminal domain-containing protein [Yinghuangia aomiensis]
MQPDANAVWAAIRDDRTSAAGCERAERPEPVRLGHPARGAHHRPPTVNGSGIGSARSGTVTPGLAGRASDMLKAQGFTVTAAGTAKVQDQATTWSSTRRPRPSRRRPWRRVPRRAGAADRRRHRHPCRARRRLRRHRAQGVRLAVGARPDLGAHEVADDRAVGGRGVRGPVVRVTGA